jgi:hypothetical protein
LPVFEAQETLMKRTLCAQVQAWVGAGYNLFRLVAASGPQASACPVI